jgi:hypothetical protein
MSKFYDDLQFSHDASDNPIWKEIYGQFFPTAKEVVDYREMGEHQLLGIDRMIALGNTRAIYIDEKVRRKDYGGDIFLEVWSSEERQTPGWIQKPLYVDYIAYAVLESGKAYLLPVLQLQEAWIRHGEQWEAKYGTKKAFTNLVYDGGYHSVGVPVPVDILFRAIGGCLRCDFKSETEILSHG